MDVMIHNAVSTKPFRIFLRSSVLFCFLAVVSSSNAGWSLKNDQSLVGVRLLDYRIEQLESDQGDQREDGSIRINVGDSLKLSCTWQITDRLFDTFTIGIVLHSPQGKVIAAFPLGSETGRSAEELRIGERLREEYSFVFRPAYNGVPDLFQEYGVYKLQIQGRVSSFFVPYLREESQPTLFVYRNALPRGALCLTGNPDVPTDLVVEGLVNVEILPPRPILHDQARASSVEGELLDGLVSGTHNYNWESIIWQRISDGSIEVNFLKPVSVEAVVIASPSPYPNWWLGGLTVEAVRQDGSSIPVGEYENEAGEEKRQLHILVVRSHGEVSRTLRIQLHQADAPGITNFAVSELYIWGRVMP
jgi:hypothetical protein